MQERSEDIPLLVNTFIRRLRTRTVKKISGLTPAAMERFMGYHWPGNVRELKRALEFAFVIAEKGLIDLDQLPPNIAEPKSMMGGLPRVSGEITPYKNRGGISISTSIQGEKREKEALVEALRQCNGNQTQTARVLGINRVTVWNRMKKYGIDLKKVLHV